MGSGAADVERDDAELDAPGDIADEPDSNVGIMLSSNASCERWAARGAPAESVKQTTERHFLVAVKRPSARVFAVLTRSKVRHWSCLVFGCACFDAAEERGETETY